MNGKKNVAVTVGFVLAVSLITASLTNLLCWRYYSRTQFRMLGEVCGGILQQSPEAEKAVAAALKICQAQTRKSGKGQQGKENETGQQRKENGTGQNGMERQNGSEESEQSKAEMAESSGQSETGQRPGSQTGPDGYAQNRAEQSAISAGEDFLMAYGYQERDFLWAGRGGWLPGAIGFLAGAALFLLTFLARQQREKERIRSLTEYLENVNTGGKGLLLAGEEDAFSGLQDEIYKTVTTLYQTRDAALRTRDNYAENLSNIAHQIKTPITSISLAVQMLKAPVPPVQGDHPSLALKNNPSPALKDHLSLALENNPSPALKNHPSPALKNHPSPGHLEQISQQLSRLTRLEEELLLLSRIEAGTLPLAAEKVDVFTLLTLAGDNLQELFHRAQVSLHIPEAGEMAMTADLEWTMEAVMNLMKNCLEHTPPGGKVSCAYEQNPLYTQIRIWDSGSGFAEEDLPRLFERFYRGAGSSGIGIGLSLAKEIIERQNGTISARNLAEGGACFEIRMYSH